MSEGFRLVYGEEWGERYPVDADALATVNFDAKTTCWLQCEEGEKCMRPKNHTGPHVSYGWRGGTDPGVRPALPIHVVAVAMWFS